MTGSERTDESDRPTRSPTQPHAQPHAQPPAQQGVYGIGVTSDLVGTGIQNLRAYEKAGLVEPHRTPGGTRLYSGDDVTRLRRIHTLLGQGLNLAGIAMILDLENDNQQLRTALDEQHQAGETETDT